MPLVFVHGVNTRNSDEDYARSVAARKTMFEQFVAPVIKERGFPDFPVADDIYWGDLGVRFAWQLRSVPPTKVLQSLGPAGEAPNLDLIELLSDTQAAPSHAQSLGADQRLAVAAQRDPGALVRAIFAPDADKFAPPQPTSSTTELEKEEVEKASSQGEHLGLMLIAVEAFAREAEKDGALVTADTDSEVLEKIETGVTDQYRKLVAERNAQASAGKVQHLGKLGNPFGWVTNHISGLIEAAKSTAGSVANETGRLVSLLALKQVRDGLSRRALRFLGDVFVYLRHGKTASPAIFDRVKGGLLALNGSKNEKGEREPFILVTHSFGSEIAYELLASGALGDLVIDLWVTAGAQTSLFAEMLLYEKMPELPADTSKITLGRPKGVNKWINFYDAADVLSYLHEPVFGKDAVTDIPVRAEANATNAHGHYFLDTGFYERIAKEV